MRGKTANGLIIEEYAREKKINKTIAYKHRREQRQEWVEWCKDKGYNSQHLPENEGGKRKLKKNKVMSNERTTIDSAEIDNLTAEVLKNYKAESVAEPQDLVQRYRVMENKNYTQLRQLQSLLDYAISNEQFQTLRTYIQGVKDLTATYNELCRLRRIAEIQEGEILPMAILDRYKTTFYPRLEAGVDEMRISIENNLPPEMVADFQRAWNKSYYRYKDAAKEAEKAITEFKLLAADEALGMLNKKESNKLKAQSGIREKLRENLENE